MDRKAYEAQRALLNQREQEIIDRMNQRIADLKTQVEHSRAQLANERFGTFIAGAVAGVVLACMAMRMFGGVA